MSLDRSWCKTSETLTIEFFIINFYMYEILFITATKLLDINNLRKEDLFWFTTSEQGQC